MVIALACPVCDEDASAQAPDMYGVRRCGRCGVEFRPPQRVPIRQVGVAPHSQTNAGAHKHAGWIAAVVMAAGVGGAVALGDAQAPGRGGQLPVLAQLPSIEPPELELDLEGLGLGAVARLEYEIQTKQVHGGELFVTGTVRNPSAAPVHHVSVTLGVRDAQGAHLGHHEATLACRALEPGEACPWSLEAELGVGATEFEFAAHGMPPITALEWVSYVARCDREGAALDGAGAPLRYDPEANTVEVERRVSAALTLAWLSVTALDEQGRVLQVVELPGLSPSGVQALRVPGVRRDEAVDSYELRFGGTRLELEDGFVPPSSIELPPVELPPEGAR